MPDVPIIDNSERRMNETVCIDTRKIFDSCVSKDCLENLRVSFFDGAQDLIDNAITVKTRTAEVAAVSVDVDEVPFNRGYYNVDITYYFRLGFDTYSAPCTTPQVVEGYTSFNKKCILYGSEGRVKIFASSNETDNLECPESPQYTNPTAKLQLVDPVILDTDVMDASCPSVPPLITSFPQSILDNVENPVPVSDGVEAVLVSLGLFSIVQMERDCQILIPAYDYCIPERECQCNTEDPCSTFRGIDFPVEEFFPVERDENNNCCNNNE
ncbi:MAG: hypothetical protein IJR70_04615 [Eubacterium sp.]|nr:hypothetical protein [Eubacterium sp.]